MNDGINGPVCQCGESMDVYHGVVVCPHCDCEHPQASCVSCRRYGYYLNMRILNEYNAERRGRDHGTQRP